MNTKQWRVALGVVVCAVTVVMIGAASGPLRSSVRREYPDPPFVHLHSTVPSWTGIGELSEIELAALEAVEEGNYIEARELVEHVLSERPDSIPAFFLLAQIELRGEGNPAAALYAIRRARYRLQELGRTASRDRDACAWYIRVLDVELDILQQMDRSEEQLRVADLLAAVYEPMPWRKTWPLIKLRRYDDVRKNLEESLGDERGEATAWNGLCALEDKLGNREGARRAGRNLVLRFEDEPVFWSNYGLAAYNAFRFDEAESAFVRAGSLDNQSLSNPYLYLSLLFLQQARLPEAADALRRAQAERLTRSPASFSQDQAQMDMGAAMLLCVAGRGADAIQFARRAYHAPDRAGFTSIDERDQTVANRVLYWTVLGVRLQELREAQAATGVPGRWQQETEIAQLAAERWVVERQLRKQLHGPYLVQMLRPTVPGGCGIEAGMAPWLRGAVVQIVPPAVAAAALRQARQVDDLPEAAAYLDAMEAEIALALDQPERALRLGQQALNALPAEGERLLRARVQAIAGAALLRSRDVRGAREQWEHVLQTFPQVFRMLQLAIPVSVRHDDSDAARGVAEAICRSPRFTNHPDGCGVKISTHEDRIACELGLAAGSRHSETGIEAQEDTARTIARATAAFHDQTMQPLVDLTQLNIDSLNGRASVAQSRARLDLLLNSFLIDQTGEPQERP